MQGCDLIQNAYKDLHTCRTKIADKKNELAEKLKDLERLDKKYEEEKHNRDRGYGAKLAFDEVANDYHFLKEEVEDKLVKAEQSCEEAIKRIEAKVHFV